MPRRMTLISLFAVFLPALFAGAPDARAAGAPSFITERIPGAALCGKGAMRFFMWNVYEAELYAGEGECAGAAEMSSPLALRLRYLRDFKGKAIADRSVSEMRTAAPEETGDEILLAAWHEKMKALFPDVKKGDSITGVYLPGEDSFFYVNGAEAGAVGDARFGKPFFSIWLSENTSAPSLRTALLGGGT